MIRFLTSLTDFQQLVLIILAGLVFTLPGLIQLPPLDRDEARFAQATAQMLETGDFLRIRFQGDERNKKPAGIHWLQAASVSMFSSVEARAIWAYRLPSMLGIIIAMVSIWALGRDFFDHPSGVLGALLFGMAPVAMGEATIAKTDAMLTGLTCVMMVAMVKSIKRDRKSRAPTKPILWPLIFWTSMGAAILIKGPIAPMIALLTALSLMIAKRWNEGLAEIFLFRLRPVLGLMIVLLMIVPWMLAINHATDGRFFTDAIGGDFLGKVGQSKESHGAPPGYHLILLPILMWPVAMMIPQLLVTGWQNRKSFRAMPVAYAFLLAWIIPAWLVFELSATKLPHYTLPLYPAIALVCARMITQRTSNENAQTAWRCGGVVATIIGIGFAVAMIIVQSLYRSDAIAVWIWPMSIILGFCSLLALVMVWRNKIASAAVAFAALSFASGAILLTFVLPSLDRFGVSPTLSQALIGQARHPLYNPSTAGPVIVLGYSEPSAVFLIGTRTILAGSVETAIEWMAASHNATAIIEERSREAFEKRAADYSVPMHQTVTIDGYNYSKGDPVRLTFFERGPTTPDKIEP